MSTTTGTTAYITAYHNPEQNLLVLNSGLSTETTVTFEKDGVILAVHEKQIIDDSTDLLELSTSLRDFIIRSGPMYHRITFTHGTKLRSLSAVMTIHLEPVIEPELVEIVDETMIFEVYAAAPVEAREYVPKPKKTDDRQFSMF